MSSYSHLWNSITQSVWSSYFRYQNLKFKLSPPFRPTPGTTAIGSWRSTYICHSMEPRYLVNIHSNTWSYSYLWNSIAQSDRGSSCFWYMYFRYHNSVEGEIFCACHFACHKNAYRCSGRNHWILSHTTGTGSQHSTYICHSVAVITNPCDIWITYIRNYMRTNQNWKRI